MPPPFFAKRLRVTNFPPYRGEITSLFISLSPGRSSGRLKATLIARKSLAFSRLRAKSARASSDTLCARD